MRCKPLVAEADDTVVSTVPHRADNQQDIRRAGQVLTLDQQRAILLLDIYGYSAEESGAVLGVTASTVKSRAARGRARLATSKLAA